MPVSITCLYSLYRPSSSDVLANTSRFCPISASSSYCSSWDITSSDILIWSDLAVSMYLWRTSSALSPDTVLTSSVSALPAWLSEYSSSLWMCFENTSSPAGTLLSICSAGTELFRIGIESCSGFRWGVGGVGAGDKGIG